MSTLPDDVLEESESLLSPEVRRSRSHGDSSRFGRCFQLAVFLSLLLAAFAASIVWLSKSEPPAAPQAARSARPDRASSRLERQQVSRAAASPRFAAFP